VRTYGVLYVPRDIELKLYANDLGHPDKPWLFDTVSDDRPHGSGDRRGRLKCLYCLHVRGRVEWMNLRQDPRTRFRGIFVHNNTTIKEHYQPPAYISDKHEAWVEHEVGVLEQVGLSVETGKATRGRLAVPDFWVTGGAADLAGEVQITPKHESYIAKRTKVRFEAGLTPFWMTDVPQPTWIRKGPRAVIGPTTYERIRAGTEQLVVGGARIVEEWRCGHRGERCPATGRPKSCGRMHVYPTAARGLQLDALVVGAATGTGRLLTEQTKRGTKNYLWFPANALERYLNDRGQAGGTAMPTARDERDPHGPFTRACDRRHVELAPAVGPVLSSDTGGPEPIVDTLITVPAGPSRPTIYIQRNPPPPTTVTTGDGARSWLDRCCCGHIANNHGASHTTNLAGKCLILGCKCRAFMGAA
jgi:hypothetical protein